ILLPSSLDSSETALIAASLETIERIGPCTATVKVISVKDVRVMKREFMLNRAKDILGKLMTEEIPSTSALTDIVKEGVKIAQIRDYFGLPAGPDIESSDEIIIVEGRADVLNLLKNGVKNVVAIEGAKIPQTIVDLTKEKITILFVDGDRGGDLIIKEMLQVGEVDYIVKAPEGKEVEELTKKEIFKALREKIPADQYKIEPKTKELKDFISKNPQESSV
ncbi:MAG: DNA primase DnaG, partial [Candidatus Aenigmatarchaeota archaeon]